MCANDFWNTLAAAWVLRPANGLEQVLQLPHILGFVSQTLHHLSFIIISGSLQRVLQASVRSGPNSLLVGSVLKLWRLTIANSIALVTRYWCYKRTIEMLHVWESLRNTALITLIAANLGPCAINVTQHSTCGPAESQTQ